MQPITHRPAALAIALGTCIALLAGASQGARAGAGATAAASAVTPSPRRVTVKSSKIAPGLILKKYVDKKLPRRTFVLVADLESRSHSL